MAICVQALVNKFEALRILVPPVRPADTSLWAEMKASTGSWADAEDESPPPAAEAPAAEQKPEPPPAAEAPVAEQGPEEQNGEGRLETQAEPPPAAEQQPEEQRGEERLETEVEPQPAAEKEPEEHRDEDRLETQVEPPNNQEQSQQRGCGSKRTQDRRRHRQNSKTTHSTVGRAQSGWSRQPDWTAEDFYESTTTRSTTTTKRGGDWTTTWSTTTTETSWGPAWKKRRWW